MSPVLSVALYFVIWWTVLFAVLPLGVRSQYEHGEVTPGTEGAAPHRPMLLKKVLITTLVAALVFALLDLTISLHWVTLDTFSYGPSFDGQKP
jgi:predicted secreted protein